MSEQRTVLVCGYPVCAYCGNQHNYCAEMCKDLHNKTDGRERIIVSSDDYTKLWKSFQDSIRAGERAKLREAVGELTKYPTITGSVMSSSVVDCYLVSDIATIFDKEG
jgi:hypothetical protein